ncbi:MAG: two-component regulator propeller domain-containing protein, partial [Saprospiraceae bacterium]|nr:two-component regulator propeller domain-containing protein [Saprospiraceae bacterium]
MNRLFSILFLFFGLEMAAQTPVFRQQILRESGNPKVNTVLQDSKGWLWCGADRGLFRFDGFSFQPIHLADTFIKANLTALFEWQGQIWAGFSNGAIGQVSIAGNFPPALTGDLDLEKKYAPRLQLWQIEEGLPSQKITAFAADSSGALWLGTYGEGLYVWKKNRLYHFGDDDGLSSNDIYALTTDRQGRIWAATDAGINVCSMTDAGQKKVQNLSLATGLPDEIITTLLTDLKGYIWAGTHQAGVVKLDPVSLLPVFHTSNWQFGEVTVLEVYGTREMWIGTGRDGLIRLDLSSGFVAALPEKHALRQVKVHALRKDREGLLWSVLDKGLLYSANVRFGSWQPGFGDIQALLEDDKGHFWAGSQTGLFVRTAAGNFKKILPQNIISLWESPNGEIWAGTFGSGVVVLSHDGRVLRKYTEQQGLANGSVLSIGGHDKRVWLATLGGVSALSTDGGGYLQVQSELGTSYVYKVFSDTRGRVWFGTDGKGLAVLEDGALRFYTEANGTPLRTIYSITEDKRGRIWFSTDREGLFSFDGQYFQRFTIANGLHGQRITSLESDGNGMIVIGYEDGFDLLNPERVDHLMFCDAGIGAPSSGINLNATCRDARGDVWMGAKDGILRAAAFDETFVDDPQPGITAVSVLMKSVDFLSVNVYSHSDNYFIFNFAGLWFTHPESVRYRYKLEGFDPDWKVSKDHLASYPNLPPGRYTFRVQTSEHGNFDKVPEASWSFSIRPPFWQQPWFLLLGTASSISLILWFVRSREARLRREAQLKRERVESQFEALKS